MAARYAGFWLRAVAHSIDWVILIVTVLLLVSPFIGFAVFADSLSGLLRRPAVAIAAAVGFVSLLGFLLFMHWGYYAWFESSHWQATPGKRALGLYVTDEDGARISFARSSKRYFARVVSGLCFNLGFVMTAFTARKQALHDLIASTLVLRR